MPLGQQADEHALDELVLAHDDALDLEDRALERVDLLLQTAVGGGRRRVRALLLESLSLRLAGIASSALRRPTR
ncbi:hypothetical protein MPHL43072_18590 [Mycolicibacterium phlei DSM 43072]|nr:hypothetical protein MPHLEI_01956 [Mycolicibacterium phlei RIVM601174]KXW70781.1 hypothetical protein MPHL43072_18590 [Mycolicibacterium phlei DSM 43072]